MEPRPNQLPLPPGRIYMTKQEVNSLSAAEKATVEQLGLPVDQIPRDLAKVLSSANSELSTASAELQQQVFAAAQEAQQDIANAPAPVSPTFTPVNPEFVDIQDLPPEQQTRLTKAILETAQEFKQRYQQSQQPQPAPQPSPQMAPQQPAPQPAQQTQTSWTPEQMDFIQQQLAERAMQEELRKKRAEEEGALAGYEPSLQDAIRSASQYVQDEAEGGGPEISLFDDIGAAPGEEPFEVPKGPAPPALCPHCGWDKSKQDLLEVTDEDKHSFFLNCVVGRQSFVKTYDLYGGRVRLTFRTLSPSEQDEVYQAVVPFSNQFQPVGYGELELLSQYRMALSLTRVEIAGEQPRMLPGSLDEWKSMQEVNGEAWTLTKISGYIRDFLGAGLIVAAGRAMAQFNILMAKLMDNAENPDFWKATPPAN